MQSKKFLLLFGSLGILMAFQNCGPSVKSTSEDVSEAQRVIVAEALKPQTEWSLQKAEDKKGQHIELPNKYQVGLNFSEVAANPDVMCAGSCGQQYALNFISNCLEAKGDYRISFNMSSGNQDHLLKLDISKQADICLYSEWDRWLLDLMNREGVLVKVSSDGQNELLLIETAGNKLTFSKNK